MPMLSSLYISKWIDDQFFIYFKIWWWYEMDFMMSISPYLPTEIGLEARCLYEDFHAILVMTCNVQW